MLAEDERALGVFEWKVLRTIYVGIQDADVEWRRRMSHELHALLGESNIAQTARIGQLRWVGHVARMDVDSPVRLLFDREELDGGRKGEPKSPPN